MPHCTGFELLNEMVKRQILHIMPKPARIETDISGLTLTRYDSAPSPVRCLHYPMVALVIQGFKRAFYGEHEGSYGEGQCVVLGIDVPGVFQIMDASQETPFLSLSLKLDNRIISRLFAEMPELSNTICAQASPIGVQEVDFELLDAFRRLVLLLETPVRIPILAPMIVREIHFHVLSGKFGSQLKMFNTIGTKAYQISNAISWLRENYKSVLKIPDLAARVNMASSTFNRYFRQVTGLSPLQFQKHLRLYEAERLMFVENHDATTAALMVGYASSSQFSREYKKLFGTPPGRDITFRKKI